MSSKSSHHVSRRKRGISGELDIPAANDEVRFSRWGKHKVVSPAVPVLYSGTSGTVEPPVMYSAVAQPSVQYAGHDQTPVRLDSLKPDPTLLSDELLASAPRLKLRGHAVPSLGGIYLLSKLAQGGMGTVYYGIHPRLDQEVAVKVFPGSKLNHDPSAAHRFIREARIAFSVRNAHLIGVIDVNEENGILYLVMEYIDGQTASTYQRDAFLRTTKMLPETVVLDICIGATRGLEAAHRKNVIHRDVKPDNIMIPYAHYAGGQHRGQKVLSFGATKLLDLGLARREMRDKTMQRSGFSLGTPGYMAPEQRLDASAVSKAADVFSMGATMFALLTGKLPGIRRTTRRIGVAKLEPKYHEIRSLNPELSLPVAELIHRCIARRPEDRPADASALLRELRAVRRQIDASYTGGHSGEWAAQ